MIEKDKNKEKFQNFSDKKFIIFFEGWERRKYINYDVCGKADFDGKISNNTIEGTIITKLPNGNENSGSFTGKKDKS